MAVAVSVLTVETIKSIVDLVPGGMTPQPGPKMMRAETMMASDAGGGGGGGFAVSRKLTVYAVVSLATAASEK